MNTISPALSPVSIRHRKRLFASSSTYNRVPLHSPALILKFRMSITTQLILDFNLYSERLGGFKVFRCSGNITSLISPLSQFSLQTVRLP